LSRYDICLQMSFLYQRWLDLSFGYAQRLAEAFEKAGERPTFDPSIACLRVNDNVSICFGVATRIQYHREKVGWMLRRRAGWPVGWMFAIRLGPKNKSIMDYVLVHSNSFPPTVRDGFPSATSTLPI
jgi:hypothetical protein